jgi:hypothetical protein
VKEIDALYYVARDICHAAGLPWTDPRTGVTYPPPEQVRKESSLSSGTPNEESTKEGP